jgi:hypothetical protein
MSATVPVPTAAPLDPTALVLLERHIEKIAEIADDLRRTQPSTPPGDLVVRLGLHAAGAQAELAALQLSPA